MKRFFILTLIVFATSAFVSAQSKSNDVITGQIKKLKAEKTFTLSYDDGGGTSKLMVFGEDFGQAQYKNYGIQALSFGMAFFYPGKMLKAAPELINLTFWVQTKKPKFGEAHAVTIFAGNETFDLGDARYAAKPKENMEYLNFRVPRETFAKIAKAKDASAKIGNLQVKFTPAHLKLFADLIKLSDPSVSSN